VKWLVLVTLAGCDKLFDLQHLSDAAADSDPDAFDDRLVAHYTFDDATWSDATGHGHAGTCAAPACPSLVAGRVGMAASFDGIDDHIEIAGSADLATTAAFTVAAWVRIRSDISMGTIAAKRYGPDVMNSWQVHVDNDDIVFYTTDTSVIAHQVLDTTTWHHVAVRYTAGEKAIVIDGAEKALDLSATSFDDGVVVIGADIDSGIPVTFFGGDIDELRIYARALSTPELAALAAQ
jgi:hypothetical protein